MSKYVSYSGYTGSGYDQSVVWHYRTDIDRDVLNRWFVNIFEQGTTKYTPNPDIPASTPPGTATGVTINAGTSFIIEEKLAKTEGERKIAKVDMVRDYVMSVAAKADDTYYLYAMWDNLALEYVGADFYLETTFIKKRNGDYK